jgi:hypothetical protein
MARTPCSLACWTGLYGVLAQIEALGLDLLEVRQLAPQRKSPESQVGRVGLEPTTGGL